MSKYLLFSLFILLVTGCTNQKNINRAIYYWQTSFSLSNHDLEYLKNADITKIYLKFFDVDWDKSLLEPLPIGNLTNNNFNQVKFEIIPTIYITNRTIISCNRNQILQLAQNLVEYIKSYSRNNTLEQYNEIQIDCDWSENSREKYFLLLNEVKKRIKDILLSATIRLHQVKYYTRTGVPPVDMGMLMFYNMTSVSKLDTINSIFDENTAKKYLYNFDKYPLALDVALPAFSWVALYRNEKIISLINNIKNSEINDSSKFTLIKNNFTTPKYEQFFHGNYIIPGDILKTEEITPQTTIKAVKLIREYVYNDNINIAIYHFHKEMKDVYTSQILENIFTSFN